jgi:hypothetical protein
MDEARWDLMYEEGSALELSTLVQAIATQMMESGCALRC